MRQQLGFRHLNHDRGVEMRQHVVPHETVNRSTEAAIDRSAAPVLALSGSAVSPRVPNAG